MARSKPLRGYKRLPGHKYRTPRGKIITEYAYRSRKAQREGFRNYTERRRFRQRQDFQKLRFDVLAAGGDWGEVEEAIVDELRLRDGAGVAEGGPRGLRAAAPGTGSILDTSSEGKRLTKILDALGQPEWWKWRFWYSEVTAST